MGAQEDYSIRDKGTIFMSPQKIRRATACALVCQKNHPSEKRGVGKINPEGFCPKGRGLLFLLLEAETEIAATGLELGGAFLAECHTPF